MKKIEAMKKGIAIAEYNKDHTWKAAADGLVWSYLDTKFDLTIVDKKFQNIDGECVSEKVVSFEDKVTGCKVTVCVINDESEKWLCDSDHDFVESFEEAIIWATVKMIKKADYCH